MSSKMNHRKRSRYSYQMKGAAFSASSRQAYYREMPNKANAGLLSRLFHRRAPKQADPAPEQSENA
mgnify:CR=1 FL=1